MRSLRTKKQNDDENRANPDAPRQYWVLDEEAKEDVREDWVSRRLTISDDPLPEPPRPAKLHILRRRGSEAKAGGFWVEVYPFGILAAAGIDIHIYISLSLSHIYISYIIYKYSHVTVLLIPRQGSVMET